MRKAVALRYDGKKTAPELIGAAEGPAAERAIERALALGIPVVEDAPLAAALSLLELGQLVPEQYWELVASILIAIRKVQE